MHIVVRMKTLLAHWRKQSGLTLNEAAAIVSIDRSTWWRWETDRLSIPVSRLTRLSRLTGLTGAQLRPDIKHLFSTGGQGEQE